MVAPSPRLEVRDITKSFPGVKALKGVSLRVMPGEVLSVVGENGAGKSTLMKILAGVQSQDSGQILVDGKERQFRSVSDAMSNGIAIIHQELNLADNLEIGANIFLGREPRTFGRRAGAQFITGNPAGLSFPAPHGAVTRRRR